MSLQDYTAELEAENGRLRAALDERDARIDALGDAMLEMARRLDQYERPEPPEGPERSEWFGTVQWSGPTVAYEANSAEINHELAQQISRMAKYANSPPNSVIEAEIGRKEANHALQEGHQAIEALWTEDAPKGSADEG